MVILQAYRYGGNEWTDNILNFFQNGLVDSIVLEITGKTLLIGIFLGVIFYLVNLGMNYLRTSIGKFVNPDMGFFIDFDDLFRTIGILCLIVLYIPIMSIINGTVNLAYHMTKPSNNEYIALNNHEKEFQKNGKTFYMETDMSVLYEIKSTYEKNPKAYTKEAYDFAIRQIKKVEQASGAPILNDGKSSNPVQDMATKTTPSEGGKDQNDEPWYKKIMNGIGYVVMKIVNAVIGTLVITLAGIIKIVVIGIAKIWLKILFIFGPLALAFSIIPMFKKQAEHWFGFYLNTAFVFLTFNILDHIFYGLNEYDSLKNSATTGDALNYETNLLISNLVMIIAYLSVFRITSYYVGKGEAGRAVGKAAQLAGDVAKIVIGAKMLGAGGAAGGGGSNVLSGAINSMNKNSGGSKIKDDN